MSTDRIDWRAMRFEDADQVLELANTCAAEDASVRATGKPEFMEDYEKSCRSDGTLVAVDRQQGVVAAGFVSQPRVFNATYQVQLSGFVQPGFRGKGLGRRLLAWQLDEGKRRYRRLQPEFPGLLKADSSSEDRARLYRRFGMEQIFRLLKFEYNVTQAGRAPVPSSEITVVPYSAEYDEQVRNLHNEVFKDHWMANRHSRASWAAAVSESPFFRPELSMLAIASEQIVSFALLNAASGVTAAGPRALSVDMGTRKDVRDRGLALLLLQTSAAAIRSDGRYDMVVGWMDMANEPALRAARRMDVLLGPILASYAIRLGQPTLHPAR